MALKHYIEKKPVNTAIYGYNHQGQFLLEDSEEHLLFVPQQL
jgi:hypothetical protein